VKWSAKFLATFRSKVSRFSLAVAPGRHGRKKIIHLKEGDNKGNIWAVRLEALGFGVT
jgi:hypothetical protein